jgi:hypothetical protein
LCISSSQPCLFKDFKQRKGHGEVIETWRRGKRANLEIEIQNPWKREVDIENVDYGNKESENSQNLGNKRENNDESQNISGRKRGNNDESQNIAERKRENNDESQSRGGKRGNNDESQNISGRKRVKNDESQNAWKYGKRFIEEDGRQNIWETETKI